MRDDKKEHTLKEAVWRHCSIHNIDYPADDTCPQCKSARGTER